MLLPRFERFKPHTDTDLVYLKSSPDYCEFDVKRGSLGTHGRECDHVSFDILNKNKYFVDQTANVPSNSLTLIVIVTFCIFREVQALMDAS